MPLRFSHLTRPAIRKLQVGKRITEHGITAEGLSDGDVRYSINVMVDGQRIHRVVGRETDRVTRTQAEELIAKLRTDAREGRLQLPKGRKTALGFSAAADKYIEKLTKGEGRKKPKNIPLKEAWETLRLFMAILKARNWPLLTPIASSLIWFCTMYHHLPTSFLI